MSDAFRKMVVESLPRLRAYALMMTGDRPNADDLVQETVYRALRAEAQFTMGSNFMGWMYRILRNEFISRCRVAKRTPMSVDDVPEASLARRGDQEDQVLTKEVLQAVTQLNPAQREVLIMICAAGMDYAEAAAILECSVGTVKSRLWRARRHMEAIMQGKDAPADAVSPPDEEAPQPSRLRYGT
jgi:RNA polymerase sigma-70 factor (ECF subfamily)